MRGAKVKPNRKSVEGAHRAFDAALHAAEDRLRELLNSRRESGIHIPLSTQEITERFFAFLRIRLRSELGRKGSSRRQREHPNPSLKSFIVYRTVDAYIHSTATIEASSAREAAMFAETYERDYDWKRIGLAEMDARAFVTLDSGGRYIEETRVGEL